LVEVMAAACHLLHDAHADGFPFVESVDSLLEQARRRLDRGLVDPTDFDEERAGMSPHELFEELCRLAPDDGQPVLTHGDLCPPNVIVQEGRTVGFVDVGRAAVSDRWRDLALCLRSLEFDRGDAGAEEFLRVYGAVRDERKLAFYTLLDEFF
jgi:aminoglycoside 3'-phosphotransferase II